MTYSEHLRKPITMPKFVVERTVPGAGTLTRHQLQEIAAKSNATIAGLGEPYVWHTSYVAGDKIYCVHEAENAEAIYRHAKQGGFPADKVTMVEAIIAPATARDPAAEPLWPPRQFVA